MKPENIGHLRTVYKRYYHPSVDRLPDGWIALIDDFFLSLEGIGDLNTAASIRFERTASGLQAFVFPERPLWHPRAILSLHTAQRELYEQSQQTCEVCGNPGAAEDGHVWCIGHAGELAAKARREAALYEECRALFPEVHGEAINLAVPDHLFDLLSTSLHAIHKLVVSEDIVGKVLITRLEIDDGALFCRVHYSKLGAVFQGTQMAINEMLADLEVLSDELTRKHKPGGSDAA
ncbi:hypothetical protein ACCS66_03840 [Rhizobium ruizarguesonis]